MDEEALANVHLVGVQGDRIVILNPPCQAMDKQAALVFAAWIVALADSATETFPEILRAVQST